MKAFLLITICLIFIGMSNAQEFVDYGTGVAGIPYQNEMPEMKSGCLFLACCVIGGLGTRDQVLDARNWALGNGYISDTNYVQKKRTELPQIIADHYGTTYHSDFQIREDVYGGGKTHFWVANSEGKEIFNSAGLGWHGN